MSIKQIWLAAPKYSTILDLLFDEEETLGVPRELHVRFQGWSIRAVANPPRRVELVVRIDAQEACQLQEGDCVRKEPRRRHRVIPGQKSKEEDDDRRRGRRGTNPTAQIDNRLIVALRPALRHRLQHGQGFAQGFGDTDHAVLITSRQEPHERGDESHHRELAERKCTTDSF